MNRIEKIIKKAECIREYLEENKKEKGNLDQLIESLKTYHIHHGDLPGQKHFHIIVTYMRLENIGKNLPVYQEKWDFKYHHCVQDEKRTIVVKSSEFTLHIMNTIIPYIKKEGACVFSMPPAVADYDVADAVWDIESTKIDDIGLTNKLIEAGFKPTSNNIKFVKDFD